MYINIAKKIPAAMAWLRVDKGAQRALSICRDSLIFKRKKIGPAASMNDLFHEIFSTSQFIVQVGANDGKSNDPVNSFLKTYSDVRALLIEPIPYYFDLLKKEYAGECSRVSFLNACISDTETTDIFYFIDPKVADEMDGQGPYNRWAHGQGSFSRDTIVQWIYANKFRGPDYCSNIHRYIAAIKEFPLATTTLKKICQNNKISHIDFLVLDVQGHELSVLKGLDLSSNIPNYIYYEEDTRQNRKIHKFLEKYGYEYLSYDDSNKLFKKKK